MKRLSEGRDRVDRPRRRSDRRLERFALALGAVVLGSLCRAPAKFPAKPITLIVAYSAGGGTDISARLLAEDLKAVLGQPVVVQNIAGGGGWSGWSAIARSRPDGYTIGYLNVPNLFAGYLDPAIGRKENLDSFTLLANHVTDPCVWAVRADRPFRTVANVISAAKSAPTGLSITAHGFGNEDHLAIVSMEKTTGARFRVVHNRGTAESKAQVLGGHVEVLAANVSEVLDEHRQGRLRVLGVMAATRSPFLPDVATFKEQGFDQEWAVWRGIAGPRGLPPEVAAVLERAIQAAVTSEAHRRKAHQLGLALAVKTGRAYRRFLDEQERRVRLLMGWGPS